MAKDKDEKKAEKESHKPDEPEKLDHSGGVAIAEDLREDFVEKMFLVGLTMDAPMHYVTVPTLPGYKAVNVTKKLTTLDPHPNNEDGVMLLSRSRNRTGRHEALCKEEFDAFVKFVRNYAFKIVGMRGEDSKGKEVQSPRCNGVLPIKAPKDAGVTRSRRDQETKLWPMAKYVYIVLKKDESHFEGMPPTIAQMDEAGKKLEF